MSDNYFDIFSKGMGEYSNFLSKRQIDATAPKLKFYILDRTKNLDSLYNESKNLVYLPYFSIRGLYLTQKWTQNLGSNSITEPDSQPIEMILNMDDMVKTLRSLKQLHKTDLYLSYSGYGIASVEKNNELLIIKENCNLIESIDLNNYCIEDLVEYININISNFSATSDGEQRESSLNLVDFEKIEFRNEQINIYTIDEIYSNITEIIEIGDLFMTHYNVLYEVSDAFVSNLRFNTWPNYVIKGEKRILSDNLQLPDNGLNMIYSDGYLLGKFKNNNHFSY